MIHSIPFSCSLMKVLADFLLKNTGGNIEELMNTTVILPTHRACKQLKESIHSLNKAATVLPKILTLTDIHPSGLIPQPISTYQRTFFLSAIARALVTNPDRALKIALSLNRLLDEIYQYEIDFSQLSDLIDPIFAEHWNETLRFLEIIKTAWPDILKEKNLLDEQDYHIKQLHIQADIWEKDPPKNLLIIAGFDHTLPAVAHLCRSIHQAPRGHIFLQGVDTSLSLQDLSLLPPSHHQSIFYPFFKVLNINPNELQEEEKPSLQEQFLSKKLSQDMKIPIPKDLNHVTYIQTQNTEEEALTCALLLRKVLETPDKKAILVTNDRMLSRRVIRHMQRFQVILDDSAGVPLTKTPLGIYLMLLADYAADPQDHKTFVSLLKNPFVADQRTPQAIWDDITKAEKTARENQKKLVCSLQTDLSPFLNFYAQESVSFKDMFVQHIQTALVLACGSDKSGEERLWGSDEGKEAFTAFQEICTYAETFGVIEPAFYPEIFKILLQNITFRPPHALHPRLDILGPIEARFVEADTFILAGLNEGSWPSRPDTGVWLNRTMRAKLGLPLPEEKNAIETRDFLTFLCKKEVFLTRSEKVGGAPSLSSRYFSLLEEVILPQSPLLARKLLTPSTITPFPRPLPHLPPALKPYHLSVTQIRYLMKDPYVLYVQKVLKLKELPELENLSKNQIYGITVHKVLEEYFTRQCPPSIFQLARMGYHEFKKNGFSAIDLQFYFPRFLQVAFWFIEQDQQRRPMIKQTYLEQKGLWKIPIEGKIFELSCVADRLDQFSNGMEIIDYKTGQVPEKKDVNSGLEPQLPLEALMLEAGAFPNISPIPVQALSYWQLKGKEGGNTLKVVASSEDKKETLDKLLETTKQGFIQLITSYLTQDIPFGVYGFDETYTQNSVAHLERVQEWRYTLTEKEASDA